MLAKSKLAVKTDIIKVETSAGKYVTRSWNGYYTPEIASTISPRFEVVYEHLRFENNVPVVKETNVSELMLRFARAQR